MRRTAKSSPQGTGLEQGERLQKVLARAGFGSRRHCETLISAGRVTVDGAPVQELGVRVNADRAEIAVDGDSIRMPRRQVYLAVYKPRGVLSDAGSPDESVPTVLEMAPPDSGHLFPIGRLDLRSEGLVILTSDGDVTHRLSHPRFEHVKVYYVLVEKRPGESELLRLRTGIELEDGKTAPAKVEVVESLPLELKLDTGPQRGVWLRFELTEGKKRQLRYMTAAVGLPTLRLVRWAIGPLALRHMAPGSVRHLTAAEVQKLREYAGLQAEPGARGSRGAGSAEQAGGRRDGRRGGRRNTGRGSTRSRRAQTTSRHAPTRRGAPAKPGSPNAGQGKAGQVKSTEGASDGRSRNSRTKSKRTQSHSPRSNSGARRG